MSYPDNSIVVLDIAGKRARVFCNDANKEAALLGAGFAKDGSVFVRSIQDDEDRKQLVLLLAAISHHGADFPLDAQVACSDVLGSGVELRRVLGRHFLATTVRRRARRRCED